MRQAAPGRRLSHDFDVGDKAIAFAWNRLKELRRLA
jgi:hypothetical protein